MSIVHKLHMTHNIRHEDVVTKRVIISTKQKRQKKQQRNQNRLGTMN